MEESLCELWASCMWEAINPHGIPWAHVPLEEIKKRMRHKARDLLQTMKIDPETTRTLYLKSLTPAKPTDTGPDWVKPSTLPEPNEDNTLA